MSTTAKAKAEAQEIIRTLNSGGFYCECPCGCGQEINIKDADLFYLDDFTPRGGVAYRQMLDSLKEQRFELKEKEKNIKARIQNTTRAVNIGFISERLAPALSSFPFAHQDCRSLFDPIDYVIFEGLHSRSKISRVIFTEIKTGAARLNNHQKEIKQLVEKGKVEFQIH
ncbi:MAG TPA: Holliday junction resolvase-like protein [Flavisolibacter sp.]|jgi:predicted Holliday junction resolvase-like endonuclease|nr:Holliday junction resolvase-like protein [Flavisolibacter sp.]